MIQINTIQIKPSRFWLIVVYITPSGLILSREAFHSGKYSREGKEPSLFLYFCIKDNKLHLFVCFSWHFHYIRIELRMERWTEIYSFRYGIKNKLEVEMHNILSRAQFDEWRHLERTIDDLKEEEQRISDYYECLIECDSLNQQECKRVCRKILDPWVLSKRSSSGGWWQPPFFVLK